MNRLLSLKHNIIANQSYFQKQRLSSTINSDEMKKIVYGPNYKQRDQSLAHVKEHPQIFQDYHLTEASRQQQRKNTTEQFVFLKKTLKKVLPLKDMNNPNRFTLLGNGYTFHDLNTVTKLGVHYSLYLKTIERLGTSDLHNKFYKRACEFKDFGCFALTELMHGSNVKGILTEAHYDHGTKELVINSPSKDAIKFWIGGAAKTSNITILWAQLYIDGKSYGVHAIIVPLRDNKTHQVLPGITIGDCGPKFGLNAIDNGFIQFNKVRVPVANLLNRVSGINEKGEFFNTASSENKRFGNTLAALSEGRLFMCCHSTTLALSALAIAIRYTFVRRQFSFRKDKPEQYLMEYPLTMRRMIPLLALEVIYMCVTMSTFYAAQNNEDKNNLSPSNPLIKQIHAISSVLKSKTAWAATKTIRQCRQMMGGHGYSAYSKMAALYSNNDVNNTWEGQNHVLIQQTTKYVIENFQKGMKGKKIQSPILKFLENPPDVVPFEITKENIGDFQAIRKYLMIQVYARAQDLGMKMMSMKDKNLPFQDIWNGVQAYQGQSVAMHVADLYILDLCLTKIKQFKDEKTKLVFENMLHLWALQMLKNDEGINENDHALIEKTILSYCEKLVPEVLGILESLVAGEEVLGTPLANQRGQGFQKYMKLLLSSPKNVRSDYWEIVASK